MLHVTGAWSVPRVEGSTGEGHVVLVGSRLSAPVLPVFVANPTTIRLCNRRPWLRWAVLGDCWRKPGLGDRHRRGVATLGSACRRQICETNCIAVPWEDVPSSVVPHCLALKGVPGRKAQVLAHEAPQYISAQKSWRPHPGQQPSSASGQFIESAVLTRHRRLDGLGKRGIADQEAEFDIPILGAEREVGAGKQQHLVVDNNELCRG